MASAQREAPLKAQGKRNPHIIILDADQGVLKYLQRILSDRFELSLLSEVAGLTAPRHACPVPPGGQLPDDRLRYV